MDCRGEPKEMACRRAGNWIGSYPETLPLSGGHWRHLEVNEVIPIRYPLIEQSAIMGFH